MLILALELTSSALLAELSSIRRQADAPAAIREICLYADILHIFCGDGIGLGSVFFPLTHGLAALSAMLRDRSLPHAAPGAGLRQGAGGSRAYGRGGSPRLPEGRPCEKRRNRINSGRNRLPPGHTTGIFAKNRQTRWKKTGPAESQSYDTALGKRFSGIGLFRRVKGCGETPNRRRERWRKTQP